MPVERLLLVLAAVMAAPAFAQTEPVERTPPVAPRVQSTPLPPPVELPPPPGEPSEAAIRPLTADEAARIALRRQPDVRIARSGVEAAAGRTETTRADQRPSVDVSGGYARLENLSGSGGGGASASDAYQASVNLRQLLFDFGNTRDRVRQAAESERAASRNLERVRADLVLRVKSAFYTYVQNTRLVTANEANLENRRSQLALARARLDSGVGLPSDVVRAETGVADAVLGLQVARNNASLARVNLAALMGVDPRTPIEAAGSSEPAQEGDSVDAFVQDAVRRRPEMLQAQAALAAAEAGLSAARTDNAPSVSANVGLGTRGSDFPPNNSNLTVGASVQWDLYDGGATSGRVRQARADVSAAEADIEAIRLSVIADVSSAYLDLRTAEQRVETAAAQVTNAEEGVRLAEGRYRAGLGTFLEVTDTQTELLTARTNLVNARTDVDIARAALARAIGTPIPSG